MNLLKRSKPIILQKLDALLPRLSPQFNQRNQLEKEYRRRYKGYIGELKVDGYINSHFAKKYTILEDVTLWINGTET